MLAKNPGFTAVAVTALTLGIGANATVFTLANGVLFKSMPFDQNDRILYLSTKNLNNGDRRDAARPDVPGSLRSLDTSGSGRELGEAGSPKPDRLWADAPRCDCQIRAC